MKESYREGIANHSGPEPCEGGRKAALEALDRGICRLGIELRNRAFREADGVRQPEGNNGVRAIARARSGPAESKTPSMQRNSMRENREAPPPPAGSTAGRRENAMSGKSLMNGGGESYSGVVPTKQPNKSEQSPAEVVEGRPLTKENTQQPNLRRTPSRESGPSGLERVREAARKDGKLKFTALLHHVSIDLLRKSYHSLKKTGGAGSGWDDVGRIWRETWRRG